MGNIAFVGWSFNSNVNLETVFPRDFRSKLNGKGELTTFMFSFEFSINPDRAMIMNGLEMQLYEVIAPRFRYLHHT